MKKVWDAIRGTLFWSYDRGSWPYDAMVVAILIFVLLTPRRWFNDQPQSATPAMTAQIEAMIQLVAQDDNSHTRTYRLSANVLPPNKRAQKPTPELEEETHEILGRTVEELKGRIFQVRQIEPVRGDDGSIQYYDVAVKL